MPQFLKGLFDRRWRWLSDGYLAFSRLFGQPMTPITPTSGEQLSPPYLQGFEDRKTLEYALRQGVEVEVDVVQAPVGVEGAEQTHVG